MLRIVFIFFFVSLFSPVFAQQEVLEKIISSYEVRQPLGEEVFVHTDKSFYVCGEVMWFKVYVMNEQSHQLQSISHTAYIELVNGDNKSVLQAKVRIDSGTGSGSLFFPLTMPSGNYVLRAYTNWMRNQSQTFFEKPVTVINTRKEMDTTVMMQPATTGMPGLSAVSAGNYKVEMRTGDQPSVFVQLTNASDPSLYMIIHRQHSVFYSAWQKVQDQSVNFPFAPTRIPEGFSQIDILNSEQKVIYSTSYFREQEKSNAPVNLASDKEKYQPRKLVTLQLQNLDIAKVYNLSASVYYLSDLNRPSAEYSLPAYLGTSPVVMRSQSSDNSNHFSQTQSGDNVFQYLPEFNGMLVRVIAKKSSTGEPASDVPVYISVEGKLPDVQVGKTNKEGLAYFNFRNLYGTSQLVLQTDPAYQGNVDLGIEKSYVGNSVPVAQYFRSALTPEAELAIEALHNHTVVDDNYFGTSIDSFALMNQDSLAFFGKPYKTYLLDNYKRFITMEEVLREYVQEVNVRIRGKEYFFQTYNRQYFDLAKYMTLTYMMTEGSPLVLLDGVPVFDNNKIMKYNPLLVRKLDIVADRFHIGTKSWNGLMSFVTYKGALEDFKLDPRDVVVDFDGWQRPRYFYSPDYSQVEVRNNRTPDFRNVLYWNPKINLKSTAELHFYTGDLTGKFAVVVQGISGDGIPVYATTTLEVQR